mmetsp:Transcript_2943/g.11242  ORF Transcript_2943/g.11242 Transcript_2943/m.11242 type:complete len:220 (+) Transcript_2943:1752-2411(+)
MFRHQREQKLLLPLCHHLRPHRRLHQLSLQKPHRSKRVLQSRQSQPREPIRGRHPPRHQEALRQMPLNLLFQKPRRDANLLNRTTPKRSHLLFHNRQVRTPQSLRDHHLRIRIRMHRLCSLQVRLVRQFAQFTIHNRAEIEIIFPRFHVRNYSVNSNRIAPIQRHRGHFSFVCRGVLFVELQHLFPVVSRVFLMHDHCFTILSNGHDYQMTPSTSPREK